MNKILFNWLEDHNKLIQYLIGADIAIIDSYLAGLEIYHCISKFVSVPVFIDDNNRLDFPRGIILNGSVYAENLNYREYKGLKNLLGPKYIPLRDAFQNLQEKKNPKDIGKIMVTFGGTDTKNLTQKILQFLINNYPSLKKYVILGNGFKNKDQIKKISGEKIKFIENADAGQMKEVMMKSDIAISSCGQTLYELAAVGVPTIGIGVAENQRRNIEKFKEIGFLKYAGWWEDRDLLNNIANQLELLDSHEARLRVSQIGRNFVSNEGSPNAIDAILENYDQVKIELIPADKTHSNLLYAWVNEESVRKNSFNSEKIPFENHQRWFDEKLQSDTSYIYIGMKKQPIGQIRIDIDDDSVAFLDYSIDKKHRGKGNGTELLRSLVKLLVKNKMGVKTLIGRVKHDNYPSQKAFENCGFQKNMNDKYVEFSLEL
ncbi:MAG: GNAT family N-acetyltransferase [Candidatus Hodarchaeota archaeon]